MLSIISTKYYIVNLVVNYVVKYLDQILCRQFSHQLCCHLSRPKLCCQFNRQLYRQLSRPNIMSSIISTKYYIVNLVVNYVVDYLVISSCPFRGSVHLGANCCCQIYSTYSYLRNVENFLQIPDTIWNCVHFGSTFFTLICALVSYSESHCFVGDEI